MQNTTQNTSAPSATPTNSAKAKGKAKPIALTMQGLRPTATRGFWAVRALVNAGFNATFVNEEKDSTGGPIPQAMHKAMGGEENTSENIFHGKYAVHAINALLLTPGIKVTYNGATVTTGLYPKGMQAPPTKAKG